MRTTRSILHEMLGIPPRDSIYLRLHPLTKISVAFLLSIALIFATNIATVILLLVAVTVFLLLAKIPLGTLQKYIVVIISISSFIILAIFLLSPSPEGNIIYKKIFVSVKAEKGTWEWGLIITDKGVEKAIIFISRILVMVLTATLLLGSLSDWEVIWGLRSLRVPYVVSLAIALFFRGIALFLKDFQVIRESMMVRGLDIEKGSLFLKFKAYIYSLTPLIVLMIRKSQEISLALETRGISLKEKTSTLYYKMSFTKNDFLVILSTLAILIFAAFVGGV